MFFTLNSWKPVAKGKRTFIWLISFNRSQPGSAPPTKFRICTGRQFNDRMTSHCHASHPIDPDRFLCKFHSNSKYCRNLNFNEPPLCILAVDRIEVQGNYVAMTTKSRETRDSFNWGDSWSYRLHIFWQMEMFSSGRNKREVGPLTDSFFSALWQLRGNDFTVFIFQTIICTERLEIKIWLNRNCQ